MTDSDRNPRVLMILNNAPDYREPFLRRLAGAVNLTVVARPCGDDRLTPPAERVGYRYIEISAHRKWGVVWQPGLAEIIDRESWDIICSSINMRDLGRLRVFFRRRELHRSWIWWGHIFGHTPVPGLELVRGMALRRSAGALTFNEGIAATVRERFHIPARSFNNTQVRETDFRDGWFRPETAAGDGGLHLLFVGRYQPRKKLERLVELVGRRPDVSVRVVGPGMDEVPGLDAVEGTGRFKCFGRTVGPELEGHFDWADIVANPGHVGLLVMNAAAHGKGIVIDSRGDHAPEYWLAKEAEQPFIDFGDAEAVDRFVDECRTSDGVNKLREWGVALQTVAKERYTIEHMAQVHIEMFREVMES